MFKDMDADPYLKTAGISGDWPFGRGTYISEDRRVSIWCNEEDHLRVTVLTPATTSLNEPFNLLNATLKALESVDGVEFKRSDEFGYVTSCPSNLGTGMRASVMVCLPLLTADETTDKASEIAKPFGLSVRGSGGEHTPVVGHMVDICESTEGGKGEGEGQQEGFEDQKGIAASPVVLHSHSQPSTSLCPLFSAPSARFGISEAVILTRLFEGVKAMMEQENKLKEAVPA